MIPLYRGDEARAWLQRAPGPPDPGGPEAGVDPREDGDGIRAAVAAILRDVRERGDAALAELAARFGDPPPEVLPTAAPRVQGAWARVPRERRAVLERAAGRIRAFADAVMDRVRDPVRLPYGDCEVGLRFQPVGRAACYVPAGRYPLPSTALMTAIPARVAGVPEVWIFTPRLHDEIACAAVIAGADRLVILGGAQAVAAAALGTATVPRADLVVGPGNAYVTEAKRQLLGTVGIDMLAGPSEVVVIADGGADPEWVALDLLAQAEHDPEARAYLLTDTGTLAEAVAAAVPRLVEELRLPGFVAQSLARGALLVLGDLEQCFAAADLLAPEHLQLQIRDPEMARGRPRSYGALFLGDLSAVPLGDYCAGPNHTLPTRRAARFSGALTPLTFLRAQGSLRATAAAAALLDDTERFAELEGLTAHAAAARARMAACRR